MKCFINVEGDPSVGIPHSLIEVEIKDFSFEDADGRDVIREKLSEVFSVYYDSVACCTFEDECPDCGELLKDKRCKNESCIQNFEVDKDDN